MKLATEIPAEASGMLTMPSSVRRKRVNATEPTPASPLSLRERICALGISFVLHATILLLISLVYVAIDSRQPPLVLQTALTDRIPMILPLENHVELDSWDVQPDTPVSLQTPSAVPETLEAAQPQINLMGEALAVDPIEDSLSTTGLDLGERLEIQGSVRHDRGRRRFGGPNHY